MRLGKLLPTEQTPENWRSLLVRGLRDDITDEDILNGLKLTPEQATITRRQDIEG